ncbi:MAG: peptidyl-prolyl cis-trans isomerase [Candidatus Omnitrophota bacterium]
MHIPNRKERALAIFICLVLLFLVSCGKIDKLTGKKNIVQPKGTVIARVGDMAITSEQLDQEVQNYNQLVDDPAAQIATREQRLAYLNEELIRRYLFYLEAKTRGLEQRPVVREVLQGLEINVLANQFMQDAIGNLTATSSEVEDFYNIYKDQYQQAEERKIREIAVDSEQDAKDVLVQLLQGADFADLATQRSRAESAGKGGDLGFIKKGGRGADFAAFDEVAFSRSLNAGQISNIFKTKDRYYIIKVESVKGGQARPISEVWDEINRTVLFLKQQEKLQEISANLSKKSKVVIYEDKIK